MNMRKRGRMILVPYPAQGHVSPMQKLALALAKHGFEAVIIVPQYIHRQIIHNCNYKDDDDDDEIIKWVGLPDGLSQGDENETLGPDFFGIESAMEKVMPTHLEDLLQKLLGEEVVPACVVVDLLASWAIGVAHRCGIPAAGFWPAMLASYRLIAAIPHLLRTRLISDSGLPQNDSKIGFVVPGLPMPIISTEDLPWLIGTVAAKKARFKFWTRTLERSTTLKWILVNSFPDESETPVWKDHGLQTQLASRSPRVLPIGPIAAGGDHQLTWTKSRLTLSLWEEDLSCLNWLAQQKPNSVVYISFGSWVSPIGEPNLKSLALALEASGRPFIWVLRPTWREGLPLGFMERVSNANSMFNQGQGRVVSWAPQLEILQHKSVGCYLTHCGWNSIMEALQFQKRLLCYPVAGDQFVNCAYVVQVWRVGLKLNGLGQKDVEQGLVRVMEEEDEEMDTRLMTLHQTIMGMQGAGATARGDFLLKAFVEDLMHSQQIKPPPTFH